MPQSIVSDGESAPDDGVDRDFAARLRQFWKEDAPVRLSFGELKAKTGLDARTLRAALNGNRSSHWATVETIISALGGDVGEWHRDFDARALLKRDVQLEPMPETEAPTGVGALPELAEIRVEVQSLDEPVKSGSRRGLQLTIYIGLTMTALFVAVAVALVAQPDTLTPGSWTETTDCVRPIHLEGNSNLDGEAQQRFVDCIDDTPTRAELLELAAEFAQIDPSGPGPWPYYVTVNQLGLKVRTSGEQEAQQIGTAANGGTLWVECQERTDFNPSPDAIEDVGPLWLRVRWPNSLPTTDTYNSSRGDQYRGYVYAAYGIPIGNNGDIPAC